jgi:hypothetical protein
MAIGRLSVGQSGFGISSFAPAVLAAMTGLLVTATIHHQQARATPPTWFLVLQLIIVAAALSAAIPRRWVRATSFVVLLGAVLFTFSAMVLYAPTLVAVIWMMVRNPVAALED